MIITLSGVTGVGKSYLKGKIIEKLGLKNLIVVTTRPKRSGEIDGKDKYFITIDEYNRMKQTKEISVTFNFLGENYAYYTKDLISTVNSITELHYTTINLFKVAAKDVISIYLLPIDIEIAIDQLRKRNLPKETEQKRILEIKDQLEKVKTNPNIIEQFDYVIENDYSDRVADKIVDILQNKIKNT